MAGIDRTGDKFSTWLSYEKETVDRFSGSNFNHSACAGQQHARAAYAATRARVRAGGHAARSHAATSGD